MSRRRPWTPAEDAALRAGLAAHLPWKVIAQRVGRPVQNCHMRRKTLGLEGNRNPGAASGKVWNKAEEAIVHASALAGKTDREIARRLDRSEEAVAARRYKLGLVLQRTSGKAQVDDAVAWSEADIAYARQRWAEGATALAIGLSIGRSKNAVLGKLNRLGLSRTPAPPPPLGLPVSTRSTCAWIHGDPGQPGWSFCGKPVAEDKPYCPAHCQRAYTRMNIVADEVAV